MFLTPFHCFAQFGCCAKCVFTQMCSHCIEEIRYNRKRTNEESCENDWRCNIWFCGIQSFVRWIDQSVGFFCFFIVFVCVYVSFGRTARHHIVKIRHSSNLFVFFVFWSFLEKKQNGGLFLIFARTQMPIKLSAMKNNTQNS